MKSKPFILVLVAALIVGAAISIYVAATVGKVEKSITAFPSPDGRYKAVQVSLSRSGNPPYCFNSVAIFLSAYPDEFAESEKSYQVFAAPCANASAAAAAAKITWLSDDAVQITYVPAPAGADISGLRRRVIDASRYVHVTYVAAN